MAKYETRVILTGKVARSHQSSSQTSQQYFVPSQNCQYSKCKEYTFLNITNNTCSKDNFDQNEQKSCSEILYDHEYYGSTLISEFGLSCGGEWKIPLVESMSFVGIMIAAMSCGLLADNFLES